MLTVRQKLNFSVVCVAEFRYHKNQIRTLQMDNSESNNFVLSVLPCFHMFHLYWKANRTFFLEV